jgi:exosortase
MPMLEYSTDKSNNRFWGLTLTTWVQIVTVTVLMCALFRFNLARLWGKTNPINGQDSNWQHSVFVPLIGIYYLYIHRDDLMRAATLPARAHELSIRILSILGMVVLGSLAAFLFAHGSIDSSLLLAGLLTVGLAVSALVPTATVFGSVVMGGGLLVFAFGIYPGQNDYIKDLGMVITLFGVATLLTGWSVMKVAWFPIVFLVVALPWPELVYAKLAWPLQQLAASAAVGTLRVCNVDASNFGTRIRMFGAHGDEHWLNVAEACAGLKSVMTFLMVAGTVAFLGARPLWEKVIITLSAIPIAIFCNTMRVAGQGLLDFYVSHEASMGFVHMFVGLIMLIPGFFLILLVGWIMEKLFIEEVDREKLAKARAGRNKRVIVEVPRKKELGDGPTPDSALVPATAGAMQLEGGSDVRAAIAAIAPPLAEATSPRVPVAVPVALPKSVMRERLVQNSPAPLSTLKPSSKPAAPKAANVTTPPAGLRPSTLKPSAPGVSKIAPAQSPSTLKPSTLKPSSPKPPAVGPGSASGTAAGPGGVRPPARSPSLAPPPRKPPSVQSPGKPANPGQSA